MTANEYMALLNSTWPYVPMRFVKDAVYHDGVTVKQLRKWRKDWLCGRVFGIVNPAPDYMKDSFDCDDEVLTYLAVCTMQNARSGRALPLCSAKVRLDSDSAPHAVVVFVEAGTGKVCLYDVRADVVVAEHPPKPDYLENT